MRITNRALVGFAVVCAFIAGAIILVVWPTAEMIVQEIVRGGDSSTFKDSGEFVLWTVAAIIVAAAAGLGAFLLFVRRIFGLEHRIFGGSIPVTATVLDVRDRSTAAQVIERALGAKAQVTQSVQPPSEATGASTPGARASAMPSGRTVEIRVDPADLARAAIEGVMGRDGRSDGLPAIIARLLGRVVVPRGAVPLVTLGRSFEIRGLTGTVATDALPPPDEVIAQGERGEGTIQTVSEVGVTPGRPAPDPAAVGDHAEDPLVFVVMQVQPRDGGEPFTAQGFHRVPKRRLATLAIGRRVAVAFLPGRPETTTIDWARS